VPDHILENGDSAELEALFDSIAHQAQPAEEAPAAAVAMPLAQTVEDTVQAHILAGIDSGVIDPSIMYEQIGQLTRKLHESMQAMGYDKSLERMAEAFPDARDRLSYIATLTESAADRVLNATDIAKPIQDALEGGASALSSRWDRLFANQLSVEEFKALAQETRQSTLGTTVSFDSNFGLWKPGAVGRFKGVASLRAFLGPRPVSSHL